MCGSEYKCRACISVYFLGWVRCLGLVSLLDLAMSRANMEIDTSSCGNYHCRSLHISLAHTHTPFNFPCVCVCVCAAAARAFARLPNAAAYGRSRHKGCSTVAQFLSWYYSHTPTYLYPMRLCPAASDQRALPRLHLARAHGRVSRLHRCRVIVLACG